MSKCRQCRQRAKFQETWCHFCDDHPRHKSELAIYFPTAEEIRNKCATIRETWPAIRLQRAELQPENGYTIPCATKATDHMVRREDYHE
jgi:hypothetical protein